MSFHISYLWYLFVNVHYLWEEGRVGKSIAIYQITVKPRGAEGLSQLSTLVAQKESYSNSV